VASSFDDLPQNLIKEFQQYPKHFGHEDSMDSSSLDVGDDAWSDRRYR
jgi:hypothetical protein